MKKSYLKVIFFAMISLILVLSSCNNSTLNQNNSSQNIISNHVELKEKPEIELSKITPELLIGTWNAYPSWGTGYSDCYCFYEDGRFMFIYNQMTPLNQINRRPLLFGTWEIRDDELIISISSQKIEVGGELKGGVDWYEIIGMESKIEKIEPSIIQSYKITDLHYDYDFDAIPNEHYRPEEGAKLRMTIGNQKFWKLTVYEGNLPPYGEP